MTRILIIDDNAMNLDITKDLLEHAGFETFEAGCRNRDPNLYEPSI